MAAGAVGIGGNVGLLERVPRLAHGRAIRGAAHGLVGFVRTLARQFQQGVPVDLRERDRG
jgi:hypothetical protein